MGFPEGHVYAAVSVGSVAAPLGCWIRGVSCGVARQLDNESAAPGEPDMRLTVIGTGYLGLTHAVCMADLGHEVFAIDVDERKIAMSSRGELPFFEPGLEPLLRKNLDSGRLHFTSSYAEAATFGEVHFLCVGTPEARTARPIYSM